MRLLRLSSDEMNSAQDGRCRRRRRRCDEGGDAIAARFDSAPFADAHQLAVVGEQDHEDQRRRSRTVANTFALSAMDSSGAPGMRMTPAAMSATASGGVEEGGAGAASC